MSATTLHETNWAGNLAYTGMVRRPASVSELQEIVAGASRVRALGSRHSFNDIADSEVLVETGGLPSDITIDRAARTITVSAGQPYAALSAPLSENGLALANLASLPHITVGGAVSTGTHGSGDSNRALSAAVCGIDIVTSDGEIRTLSRGDEDFAGAVVGIGALGVVTRLTLDVIPAFEVRQDMYRGLSWTRLLSEFDAITASGYSVSINPDWGGDVGTIRRKDIVTDDAPEEIAGAPRVRKGFRVFAGATDQLGAAGAWYDRLPHFGAEFDPSFGQEVQSEWLLDRRHAVDALDALRTLGPRLDGDVLWSTEVRTVAADENWLSGAYGRDTVGIHFTWKKGRPELDGLIEAIEAILAPFAPRPHWGKLFRTQGHRIRAAYPRFEDFERLRERLDPRGAFRNRWLDRLISR